jgi:hypothetical protein
MHLVSKKWAPKKWVPVGERIVRVDEGRDPEEMEPDTARAVIACRIQRNMEETGHPFHHKTADGTIEEADPTLEYLISYRLTDALPTVPVDWRRRGFDPYEGRWDGAGPGGDPIRPSATGMARPSTTSSSRVPHGVGDQRSSAGDTCGCTLSTSKNDPTTLP